jgi:hypothetical protein
LADFSQSQATSNIVLSQHTKHGTAEPFHSFLKGPMSDITMLCGSVRLILGLPRQCGTVAGKSLADFSKSQATSKIVLSQHTKHGTAEPFHSFLKGPMSDIGC